MKRIELDWKGPVPLAHIKDSLNEVAERYPDIETRGVYLWCVRQTDRFVITYVGKADCLRDRLWQEIRDIEKHNANLFRFSGQKDYPVDADLYCEYIPKYDAEGAATPDLVERNIANQYVLFACLKDMPQVSNVEVEGAIQIHLRRSTSTRMYLITGVSSYDLQNATISNSYTAEVPVLGLDHEICTPQDRESDV